MRGVARRSGGRRLCGALGSGVHGERCFEMKTLLSAALCLAMAGAVNAAGPDEEGGGNDVARHLLMNAQARELMAREAAQRAESDAVKEHAESVKKSAKEAEERYAKIAGGTFDLRPSREGAKSEGDEKDSKEAGESKEKKDGGKAKAKDATDTDGKTAKEAGYLAEGAKPVEPSPGRWNPIGSRAVNRGVLVPGGDADASTGPDAEPAGENEEDADAVKPRLSAAEEVRSASQELADTMNELDKVEGAKFDQAYLHAERKQIRKTLDALKEIEPKTAGQRALAVEGRKRLRDELATVRELEAGTKGKK